MSEIFTVLEVESDRVMFRLDGRLILVMACHDDILMSNTPAHVPLNAVVYWVNNTDTLKSLDKRPHRNGQSVYDGMLLDRDPERIKVGCKLSLRENLVLCAESVITERCVKQA